MTDSSELLARMNTGFDTRRRSDVDALLRQCTDEKLRRGDTARALSKARQALTLVTQAPSLGSPWEQLAAYRVGHLMLRTKGSNRKLDEIEELFARASQISASTGQFPLGPLPHIYRLAVLHRMLILADSEQHREGLRRRIRQVFEIAREEVQHRVGAHFQRSEWTGANSERGQIQEGLFNLLELAAYFLGEHYAPLEGLGALDVATYAPDDAWFLVGPDPLIAKIRLARDLALEELDSRGEADSKAVLLVFPPIPENAKWRLASATEWQEVNPEWIKILITLLKERPMSRDRLLSRLGADEDKNARTNLRKAIERANDALRCLTGRDDLDSFKKSSDPLRLTEELVIFGAVHERTYR